MHLHDQLASPAAHIVDRDDGRPPPTETDGLLTLATEDPPLAPWLRQGAAAGSRQPAETAATRVWTVKWGSEWMPAPSAPRCEDHRLRGPLPPVRCTPRLRGGHCWQKGRGSPLRWRISRRAHDRPPLRARAHAVVAVPTVFCPSSCRSGRVEALASSPINSGRPQEPSSRET